MNSKQFNDGSHLTLGLQLMLMCKSASASGFSPLIRLLPGYGVAEAKKNEKIFVVLIFIVSRVFQRRNNRVIGARIQHVSAECGIFGISLLLRLARTPEAKSGFGSPHSGLAARAQGVHD